MPTNLLGLRTGFIGSNDIAPNDPMNHQLLRSLRNLKPSDWAAWEKVVGDYEAYAERDKSYAKTLSSSHLLAIARIKLPSSVRSSLAMRRKPQISPVNLPQMDAKNFNRIQKAWEQYFRDGGGVEEISALKEDVLREPKQRRGDFSKNVELLLSLLREKDAQRFWDGRDAKTLDISWVKDILSSEMAQRRPFTIEAMTTCIRLLAKIIKFQRSLDDETQSKTVAGEINEFLTSLKKKRVLRPISWVNLRSLSSEAPKLSTTRSSIVLRQSGTITKPCRLVLQWQSDLSKKHKNGPCPYLAPSIMLGMPLESLRCP